MRKGKAMLIRTSVQTKTSERSGLLADSCPSECDGLSLYLHDIGSVALLSKAEERDLIERVRAGDEQANHRFIEANLRLVVFVAKRYRPYVTGAVDLDDLIQAGSLGLMQAVERYEDRKSTRL